MYVYWLANKPIPMIVEQIYYLLRQYFTGNIRGCEWHLSLYLQLEKSLHRYTGNTFENNTKELLTTFKKYNETTMCSQIEG